ncbi:MAG: aconitate hydratase [Oligoflexia bacterium]|nr:aconitate hydratase [Oligoflexia bacterium]MBF0367108.1 aconitate hydratase [Oligoflexia bacterium]
MDIRKTVTGKILSAHLVEGELIANKRIGIKIDQTLTQDATGTMAYLQAEALGIDRAKTEVSVSYIDHNTLQQDNKNPDDHAYLQSIAQKFGLVLSKAGNGICHQVHLERFARPGKTLLGSDSHTPTAGGVASLAIGAGGLDVALSMGGAPFFLKTPEVIGVHLSGKLPSMVAAKDVILEVLKRIGVKGGVGKVLEYYGPGVRSLSIQERATITNMGAETGATTSLFPSDEVTKEGLRQVGREKEWVELVADKDATYNSTIEIDLSSLEPMVAKPHSPANVVSVRELEASSIKVDQVCIGSCTNSSYKDLVTAALMVKGKRVDPNVSLTISPGSMSVFHLLSKEGYLADLIAAGARILECTCGPCIGQGLAPKDNAISIRTFNRNFKGRSGTDNANVYLTSVETAVACALSGTICDPRKYGELKNIPNPETMPMQESLVITPISLEEAKRVEIIRGPNIRPIELRGALASTVNGEVILKVVDDITTDHIMPAGIYLPLRSNVPEYSKHVFEPVDREFYSRAKAKNGGFVIAGDNYGQGSSREHAALCPSYLGVKAVIAKSFARIHLANLINFGIIPLTFMNSLDYDKVEMGDQLAIESNELDKNAVVLKNLTKKIDIQLLHTMSEEDVETIKAGGTIQYIRNKYK